MTRKSANRMAGLACKTEQFGCSGNVVDFIRKILRTGCPLLGRYCTLGIAYCIW